MLNLIYDHILKWDPDVVIVTWDESVTALLADLPVKVKYAYYGNPDAKSFLARIEFLSQYDSWSQKEPENSYVEHRF